MYIKLKKRDGTKTNGRLDTDEKKKLRNTNKRWRDIKKEKNVGRLRDELALMRLGWGWGGGGKEKESWEIEKVDS